MPGRQDRIRAPVPDAIAEDVACRRCGYNVRGLSPSGKCPECGTPIGYRRTRRRDDVITDAPVSYLKLLALGTWLLAVGGIATFVLFFSSFGSVAWSLIAAGAGGCLWWGGVFILTKPRRSPTLDPAQSESERRLVRTLARYGQIGWPLACGAMAGAAFVRRSAIVTAAVNGTAFSTPPEGVLLQFAAGAAILLGVLTIVPLCILLADLAGWAAHTDLADRFRDSAWILTVSLPLLTASFVIVSVFRASVPGPIAIGAFLTLVIAGGGAVFGGILFVASLVRVAASVSWAINNAITGAERDARVAEREARHIAKLMARSQRADAASAPAAHGKDAPSQPPMRHGASEVVHERRADIAPYDLAPEETERENPRP